MPRIGTRYNLEAKLDEMNDTVSFIQRNIDYLAEGARSINQAVVTEIAMRGSIGWGRTTNFGGENATYVSITIDGRTLTSIDRADVEDTYRARIALLERALRSMVSDTYPMWEHCGECKYLGRFPMRNFEGWAEVWQSCGYSPEGYAIRTGKDDCMMVDDASSYVFGAFIPTRVSTLTLTTN